MKVLIVSASQRKHSMSMALSQYINQNAFEEKQTVDTDIIELSQFPVLLDHYGESQGRDDELQQQKEYLLTKLYACDAIVFVVPEWGGMVPPSLVNLLLLTANGSAGGLPLGHKPAFAIGVSASGGGANPISLLKAYAAKNSHLTWLPLHAVVQNVEDFVSAPWQPDASGSRIKNVQSRIDVGLKALAIYAEQLKPAREQLVALSKVNPFGQ